jgi:hypothetical protein
MGRGYNQKTLKACASPARGIEGPETLRGGDVLHVAGADKKVNRSALMDSFPTD